MFSLSSVLFFFVLKQIWRRDRNDFNERHRYGVPGAHDLVEARTTRAGRSLFTERERVDIPRVPALLSLASKGPQTLRAASDEWLFRF